MKNDDKCPYCKGDVYAAGRIAVCKSCGKILPSRTTIGKPSEDDNEKILCDESAKRCL